MDVVFGVTCMQFSFWGSFETKFARSEWRHSLAIYFGNVCFFYLPPGG